MVSCGFDADVVNEVHSQREERYRTGHKSGAHISYFSYTKPILKSLFGYNFPQMKVEVSDDNEWQTVEKQARWAFVFNMNRYGWGLPLAPFAKEADGLLDHVLFRGSTVFHGFLYVAFAQFRQHVRFSWTRFGQSPRYRITPNDTSTVVPFQLDGDPGGALPLEIEVIPDRLTLFVPKHTSPQEPEV
jgi:diacylglycerol kinase family enzyme